LRESDLGNPDTTQNGTGMIQDIFQPSAEELARPECIAKSLSLQYQKMKRVGNGSFTMPAGTTATVLCFDGIWRFDFEDGSSLYCTFGVIDGREAFDAMTWTAPDEEK
jgi:hypothetical protein